MPEAVLTPLTYFTAKPDQAQTFAEALETLVLEMRQEQGCLTVNAFEQTGDAARFMLFERWASRADLDEHHAGASFGTFKSTWDALLAQAPESHNFDPL